MTTQSAQEQAALQAAQTGNLDLIKLVLGSNLEKEQKAKFIAMQKLHMERYRLLLKSETVKSRKEILLDLERQGRLTANKETVVGEINDRFIKSDQLARDTVSKIIKEYLIQRKAYYDDTGAAIPTVDLDYKDTKTNLPLYLAGNAIAFINACLGNTNTIENNLALQHQEKPDSLLGENAGNNLTQGKLLAELPDTWAIGKAQGEGDCFYDAFAQALAQTKQQPYTVKELRKLCHQYALKLDQGSKTENWIYQSFLVEAQRLCAADPTAVELLASKNYLHYLANVQYTAEEIAQGLGLNCATAIWGEQNIDGRILCAHFEVALHVVELHALTSDSSEEAIAHQMINADSSTPVDRVDFTTDMPHLAVYSNHFVPVLTKDFVAQHAAIPPITDKNTENKQPNTIITTNQGLNEKDKEYLEKGLFLALIQFYEEEFNNLGIQAEFLYEKIQKLQDEVGVKAQQVGLMQQERQAILTQKASKLPVCYQQLNKKAELDVLNSFLSINLQDPETNNSLLHIALQHHQVNVAKYLAAQGADVLQCNKVGTTPLSLALNSKNIEVIQAVLQALQNQPLAQTNAGKNNPAIKELLAVKQILVDYGKVLSQRLNTSKILLFFTGQINHLKERCQEYEKYWINLKDSDTYQNPYILDTAITLYAHRTDNRGLRRRSQLHDNMTNYQKNFHTKYSPVLFTENRDRFLNYNLLESNTNLKREQEILQASKRHNEQAYTQSIEQLTKQKVETDHLVVEQQTTIDNQKNTITNQNNTITNQKNTIMSQENIVVTQANTIIKQAKTLKKKENIIKGKDISITHLNDKIEQQNTKIEDLAAKLDFLLKSHSNNYNYSKSENNKQEQDGASSPRP